MRIWVRMMVRARARVGVGIDAEGEARVSFVLPVDHLLDLARPVYKGGLEPLHQILLLRGLLHTRDRLHRDVERRGASLDGGEGWVCARGGRGEGGDGARVRKIGAREGGCY